MQIIVSKRRGGRTQALIRKASEEHLYIVCQNTSEAEGIVAQADRLGLKIPFPITFYEFIKGGYYNKGIKGFLFDNIERLLQSVTPVKVVAITAQEENLLHLPPIVDSDVEKK